MVPNVDEEDEEVSEEQAEEETINAVDASKATKIAIDYLQGLYGNLNILMFRLEDVRMNGAKNRYFVLCSLLTNVGGPRAYYFIKVDVKTGQILKVSKGTRDPQTNKLEWKDENLPPGEE